MILCTAGLVCNWMFDVADWASETASADTFAWMIPLWVILFALNVRREYHLQAAEAARLEAEQAEAARAHHRAAVEAAARRATRGRRKK